MTAGSPIRSCDLMDRVGNERHGVALPTRTGRAGDGQRRSPHWGSPRANGAKTFAFIRALPTGYSGEACISSPGSSLLTRSDRRALPMSGVDPSTSAGVGSGQESWEAAYLRFETPRQEARKFVSRLRALGAAEWRKDAAIVDLFCGRGGGLRASRVTRVHADRGRGSLLRADFALLGPGPLPGG